jgi:hypothetical protein
MVQKHGGYNMAIYLFFSFIVFPISFLIAAISVLFVLIKYHRNRKRILDKVTSNI